MMNILLSSSQILLEFSSFKKASNSFIPVLCIWCIWCNEKKTYTNFGMICYYLKYCFIFSYTLIEILRYFEILVKENILVIICIVQDVKKLYSRIGSRIRLKKWFLKWNLFIASYSTHYEEKRFQKNHRSQLNRSLGKKC